MIVSEVIFQAMRKKSGMIPYVIEDGEPLFLFMIPSNPAYGGSKPSISKGHVDGGESTEQAAIREAEEELGLKRSNIIPDSIQLVWHSTLTGDTESYDFFVYVCRVTSKADFNEPHYETGSTHWLTAKEFENKGRRTHVTIVNSAYKHIMGDSHI